jgi:nucleoside-diphosphate-sugar epimerase
MEKVSRFLVTGAGGYIGRRLVRKLVDEGHASITAVVRPGADTSALELKGVEVVRADLSKADHAKGLEGILHETDCVLHLAAGTSGCHYQMLMNTVVATDNLLNALQGKNIRRFVLVSSFSVYQMTTLHRGGVLDETCPVESKVNLRDSYTICKVRQEHLVQHRCSEMGIPLVIIRPGKIYGPLDNPVPPQLGLKIPGICFLLIGKSHHLPLIHVANCADAIYQAGIVEDIENRVFNLVDDNLPTQRDFLQAYETTLPRIPHKLFVPFPLFLLIARFFETATRITKGNIPPIITRYRAHNLWKNLRYDNSQAKTALRWIPRISIQHGIREMFLSHATRS